MTRFHQILLLCSVSLLAWLLMQAVHELGHVVIAWPTGGSVERVVLHPLAISRTDVDPNPHPLAVAWGGPIIGVLLPIAMWGVATRLLHNYAWLVKFLAGFCLLANGLYVGVGSFQKIGDAGDIQQHGSPIWLLWLFGLVTVPTGLALWNGLGKHFGIGKAPEPIRPNLSYACAITFVLLAFAEAALFRS